MFRGKINLLLLAVLITGINSISAYAIQNTNMSGEDYLINRGYSKALIDLVGMQKQKISGEGVPELSIKARTKKYIKSLIKDPDPSIFTEDFGNRKVDFK